MSRSMRSEASSLHASEPVVSLITWRPQAWERRLSLRVDSRSQGSAVPTQGRLSYATTDWRILCRPISFDTGSAAAVGRQGRWTQRLFVWLVEGGGRWKNSQQLLRLRARSARGEKEKALHRNCAKKRTEEETCARDTAQAAEAPWRRRARETARRQRTCAVSALGVEEKVVARESAQGQVQRRERSGHARVCTGHAGR
jgi:hypothetical protein